MLVTGGYDPVEAVNGLDGLDVLSRGGIDVVVTDVIMPEQTGIEILGHIRSFHPTLPIIVISGWVSRDFAPLDEALDRGADRVLEKPFRPDELFALVEDVLRDRGPTERL